MSKEEKRMQMFAMIADGIATKKWI